MIGGIRRRFSETMNTDLWDVNQRLQPDQESTSGVGRASVVPRTGTGVSFGPVEASMKDYYKTIVQTAIEHEGWYGGMYMSIPWLRMTLAGLESRAFVPEMMWEGVEEQRLGERRVTGTPSYDAIFEAERALVQKLGLK